MKQNKSNFWQSVKKNIQLKKKFPPIESFPRDSHIPLSLVQEKLWFTEQLKGVNSTLNISVSINIKDKINVRYLEKSLAKIIDRHEILRTVFIVIDGQPSQKIYSSLEVNLTQINLQNLDNREKEKEAKQLTKAFENKPFELDDNLLWRCQLIQLEQNNFIFTFTTHHLIWDNWSNKIFARELTDFYESFNDNKISNLPELKIQYADYSQWQRKYFTQDKLTKFKDYWQAEFNQNIKSLVLPCDRIYPLKSTNQSRREKIIFSTSLSLKIKQLAQQEDTSLFITLFTAFNLLLNRYSQQKDLLVATAISGRDNQETKKLLGYFSNLILLHNKIEEKTTFRQLLQQVNQNYTQSLEYQYFPFQQLGEITNLAKLSLTRAVFSFINTPHKNYQQTSFKLNPFNNYRGISNFNLAISLKEKNKQIVGNIIYQIDLFNQKTIVDFINNYQTILETVIDNPEIKIQEIKLFTYNRNCIVDTQDKQVNLESIQTVLNQHPNVKDSLIIIKDKPQEDKQLIAYVIPTEIKTLSSQQLQQYLQEKKQPLYLIPTVFVFIESFPLTNNQEVDIEALLARDLTLTKKQNYIPPTTATEIKVADIWQEVLGIRKISIDDNFFELGGNSLSATQIVYRLSDILPKRLSLRYLFQSPTIAEFALKIDIDNNSNSLKNNSVKIPIVSRQQKNLPLSFTQERLWFINQLEGNSPLYNIFTFIKLNEQVNIPALEKTITYLLSRHESLRSNFINQQGKPQLVINEDTTPRLEIINPESFDETDKQIELNHLINECKNYTFDLQEDRLIKFTLLRVSSTDNILMICLHHIISDAWSIGILKQELFSVYQAYTQNKTPTLPDLSIQYLDYAAWQKQYLSKDRLTQQLNYWLTKLIDAPSLIELPIDKPRPLQQSYQGSSKSINLPPQLTQQLKHISKEQETTLFMIILATLAILLSRYSNQDSVVIGTPVANRHHQQCEKIIGFFANTLALVIRLENKTLFFSDLLQQVKEVVLGANENQDLPFEKLVEELQPTRSLSYNPIFQVMLAWNNTPVIEQNWQKNLTNQSSSHNSQEFENAKFDLLFSLKENQDSVTGKLVYNSDLFEQKTIVQMLSHFQFLLEQIITNPQQKLSQLELLTSTEKQKILIDWNQTLVDYPTDKCIYQLFEEQVVKTPDSTAVVFEDRQLSYQQLNQKANKIAHYLQQIGVKKETVVGVHLDRSPLLIIILLAIIKAGGAYLPLDINYPTQRLAYIIDNAEVSIIVSETSLSSTLGNKNDRITLLNPNDDKLERQSVENLASSSQANNLAYVIYTSGSTGKPKGVEIEHHNLTNLITAFAQKLSINSQDRWLAVTTISFDIAALEIFLPLITGATLHLVSQETARDGMSLLNLIQEYSPTYLQATPTTWQILLLAGWQNSPQLTALTGGEALPVNLAQQLLPKVSSLYNVYGPTETTIWSLSKQIITTEAPITIGKPIANTQVYILDSQMQPVPIGIIGELYIGGEGVARGYRHLDKLTQTKFISNPFVEKRHALSLLYKTGDYARYLTNGEIEFIGRIDNQVKLRGFRIELKEIETTLTQHPYITQALVNVSQTQGEEKQLVAYLTTSTQVDLTTKTVRKYIQDKLPEYMIPNSFLFLDKFPLTPNGKIDRKALPLPSLEDNRQEEYIAPNGEIQTKLVQIWQEVLTKERIGVNDNFFEIGGHSLLATQIVSRILSDLKVKLPLRSLFESPTILLLAQEVVNQTQTINIAQTNSSLLDRDTGEI